MNDKLKKSIIAIGIAILTLLGYQGYQQIGANYTPSQRDVVGTSANAILLPITANFLDSTSTALMTNTFADGDGGTITQLLETEGIKKVKLNVSAIGSVATSTVYIRMMGSHDGTNYFDIATSTQMTYGSTSTPVLQPTIRSFRPGTATSSYSFDFDVTGNKYTRFVTYGDSESQGDSWGVQAWIQAIIIDEY